MGLAGAFPVISLSSSTLQSAPETLDDHETLLGFVIFAVLTVVLAWVVRLTTCYFVSHNCNRKMVISLPLSGSKILIQKEETH